MTTNKSKAKKSDKIGPDSPWWKQDKATWDWMYKGPFWFWAYYGTVVPLLSLLAFNHVGWLTVVALIGWSASSYLLGESLRPNPNGDRQDIIMFLMVYWSVVGGVVLAAVQVVFLSMVWMFGI